MYTWFVDNSLPYTEYWTVYNVHSFVLQNNKILVEVDKPTEAKGPNSGMYYSRAAGNKYHTLRHTDRKYKENEFMWI